MPRLIVKSPYIKCGGKEKPSGFMKYIATRDGVQKLPMQGFMRYIGTRTGAEKLGKHGLFGDEDAVDLEKTMAEIDCYTGNVWTHIFSLKREDAERLGYNNAKAWRDLMLTHRNQIAEAMHIPPQKFRWVAAFHDEDDHPHVHMMAWSSDPKEGFLKRDGIAKIKSKLTNDIFKHEMLHLYEQKSQSRDDLVQEARKAMSNITKEMQNELVDLPEIEVFLLELSQRLQTAKGKKSYGYLTKPAKQLVDKIIDELQKTEQVAKCYSIWQGLQAKIEGYYSDKKYVPKPLSEEKAFHSIKNIIIKEADKLRLGEITFEDSEREMETDDVRASFEYHKLKEIIENDKYYLTDRDKAVEQMAELADSGSKYAQFFMGRLYQKSDIVIPDAERALEYFEQAANNGMAAAQYLLAKEYLKGKAVYKNTEKAKELLHESAQSGNQFSQYLLGKILYHEGNKEKAMLWLSKSSKQGNAYAKRYLERIESGASPSCMLAVTKLLHSLGKLFEDNSRPKKEYVGMSADKKLRMKIRLKKIALGQKLEEHEHEYDGQKMQ